MDVSVFIPTFRRPEKLSRCVAALAHQTLGGARYEVLVGVDGPDPSAESAAREVWMGADGAPGHLEVVVSPKEGQAAVRNRLLARARGRLMVCVNDDVVPEPGFLAAHVAAHDEAGRAAMVLGSAPWKLHTPDRLFDRLVRETSMVFFYDRMNAPEALADRSRDWGFRHAWGLNVSAPLGLVREAGGFGVFPTTYGYEDDELAYRMHERFGTPVLYRPEARAEHDHRMEPLEYLRREFTLGFAAWGFAQAAPACAAAMFGRDVTAPEEVAYSREFCRREHGAAARLESSFLGLSQLPASVADGEHGPALLNLLYEQHLLLKRWVWRRGLAEAAVGRAIGAERGLPSRWTA